MITVLLYCCLRNFNVIIIY